MWKRSAMHRVCRHWTTSLRFEREHAPRGSAYFDLLDHRVSRQVDDRNIVRRAIRSVEQRSVRGQRDAPRAFTDFKRGRHHICTRIDDENAFSTAGAHVGFGRIRRENHRHRFDLACRTKFYRLDRLMLYRVNEADDTVVFTRDVCLRTIWKKGDVPWATADRNRLDWLVSRRIDYCNRAALFRCNKYEFPIRACRNSLRFRSYRNRCNDLPRRDINDAREAGIFV